MIKTRDFLLYVVMFVFILVGIGFTVVSDTKTEASLAVQDPVPVVEGEMISANNPVFDIDRSANLAKLREKIIAGDGKIVQGPPVLESVDTPAAATDESALDVAGVVTDRSATYCPTQTQFQSLVSWDAAQTEIIIAEGARLVVKTTAPDTASSGTPATVASATRLQMPLTPIISRSPNCIDSPYIGVALDGSLIKNDETWRFRTISDKSIVGYARDGNPIYGPGVDESKLDSCGGMRTSTGYQYHIRERELFVLGCFASMPARFIE